MAAVAHAHIGDAHIAGLFDGQFHGATAAYHAHGHIAVQDGPCRSLSFDDGLRLCIQAAGQHLLCISIEVLCAMGHYAKGIRADQHIRNRAGVLMAHAACFHSAYGEIMQFVDRNSFHGITSALHCSKYPVIFILSKFTFNSYTLFS